MIISYYNIRYKDAGYEDSILVSGEIKNHTMKDYNSALFRIFLFGQSRKVAATGTFRIAGLRKSGTKPFEARVDRVPSMNRNVLSCDIQLEAGY